MNQTITQMDETTQQNAALVEEASAAARSMEEQALVLSESVSVFKLHHAAPPVAGKPAAVARPVVAAVKPVAKSAPAAVEPALADGDDWQEF